MIDPEESIDGSLNDEAIIPFAPVLSDTHSVESLVDLMFVIKKYDSNFWYRGEVFSSLSFGVLSLVFAYIALQLTVMDVPYYEIGKYDLVNDKS
jgi:hypothetical protein